MPPAINNNTSNIASPNLIAAFLFVIPFNTTCSGMAICIGSAVAGANVDVALYNLAGVGMFNSNGAPFGGSGFSAATTGAKNTTFFTRVAIPAGTYYLAWTGAGTVSSIGYYINGSNTTTVHAMTYATGQPSSFRSSDAASGGVLPSTLNLAHLSSNAGEGDDPPTTFFAS